jgi:putative endonuclease
MDPKSYYVYILSSKFIGTLYIGVTNNLQRRLVEHRNGDYSEFTSRYNVFNLVYMESYQDIREGLEREKRLKAWRRQWKINLINKNNPNWRDLSDDLIV